MSGRSETRLLQSLGESGEHAIGLPGHHATHDAFDKRLASHLNPSGRADRTVGSLGQDARMVDAADPRTESAEGRKNFPDFLQGSCDGTGAVDLGRRITLRVVAREAVRSVTMVMSDDDVMASEREFNERNIAEFRGNDGKVGGQFEGFPLLIMTSTGAKSGAERVNLIGYFDIDDTIYVVGSAAGRDRAPPGCSTCALTPDVTGRDRPGSADAVVARELPRGARPRYALIVELAPGFGEYEKRTDRVIPVFELVADN